MRHGRRNADAQLPQQPVYKHARGRRAGLHVLDVAELALGLVVVYDDAQVERGPRYARAFGGVAVKQYQVGIPWVQL